MEEIFGEVATWPEVIFASVVVIGIAAVMVAAWMAD